MNDLEKEWLELEEQMKEEKDFLVRLELKDRILEIKRELNLVKPPDSPYECEGCSA